jgi:hypothetical protein
MLRYFFDPTSIQTFSRSRRFDRRRCNSLPAFVLYHRLHTAEDRTNTSQTSLDGRQSRAAHTHPSVQLTWRPEPHLRSVLVGRVQQLREKALPQQGRRPLIAPDNALINTKKLHLNSCTNTASAPHR